MEGGENMNDRLTEILRTAFAYRADRLSGARNIGEDTLSELEGLFEPDSFESDGCIHLDDVHVWTPAPKLSKNCYIKISIGKANPPLYFASIDVNVEGSGMCEPLSLPYCLPHISADAAFAAGVFKVWRHIEQCPNFFAKVAAKGKVKDLEASLRSWLDGLLPFDKELWACRLTTGGSAQKVMYRHVLNDWECLDCSLAKTGQCEGPYCLSNGGEGEIPLPFFAELNAGPSEADLEETEPEEPEEEELDEDWDKEEMGLSRPEAPAPQHSEQLRLGEDFTRPEDYEDAQLRDIRLQYNKVCGARKDMQRLQKAYERQSRYLGNMAIAEEARIRSAACPDDIILIADTLDEVKILHPETVRDLLPVIRDRLIVYSAFLDGAPMDVAAARRELELEK
jgi:hypothetical protein